jgi:hypothetical protein
MQGQFSPQSKVRAISLLEAWRVSFGAGTFLEKWLLDNLTKKSLREAGTIARIRNWSQFGNCFTMEIGYSNFYTENDVFYFLRSSSPSFPARVLIELCGC